jgi:tetratricopeptide (TPR) repeat protein
MKAKAALLLIVFLAAGFVGVWQLQRRIDAETKSTAAEIDEVSVRSPNVVKRISLEYGPLAAAMYWTRAVQYYGFKHYTGQRNLQLLWPLLDIATTVDPQLIVAYRFGAIFLAQKAPTGAGRPDLAVELLERGLKANPDEWRLYQDMGYVYYFDEHDYQKASQAFLKGSENPKAYIWMKVLAAKIAGEGESLETSYFLWQQVYTTTTDEMIKQNAADHLAMIKSTLDRKQIDRLADEYEKQTGHRATRIAELVQAGLLKGVPRDPDGFPYVLGEGGKAELNLDSPLLEKELIEQQLTGAAKALTR